MGEEPPPLGVLPIDAFLQKMRKEYMRLREENGSDPVFQVTTRGTYMELNLDPANYNPGPMQDVLKHFGP